MGRSLEIQAPPTADRATADRATAAQASDGIPNVLTPSPWRRIWDDTDGPTYWLTRFFILRLLGLVYVVGFLTVIDQGLPLIGSDGLLPAVDYLQRAGADAGSDWDGFLAQPSIFWLHASDGFIVGMACVGGALSLIVVFGYANAILLAVLWLLYMSFVHIGQVFYAFGWEIQLLETGFLAIFLCPMLDPRPFPGRPPPTPVIWLYRWLIFRIMLGAGLIKMRGDGCWLDLTCLDYHFETQPIPGPTSAAWHQAPAFVHELSVLYNHLCELLVPLFVFGPRIARHIAGLLLLAFQLSLIASGNLAFLNWLTMIPILACFDDSWLLRLVPARFRHRVRDIARERRTSRPQRVVVCVLVGVVAVFSLDPIANLLSPGQAMNTSFNRLHLVNTYGAFGAVGRERLELVFEGTHDDPAQPGARWQAYEFPCKPGDVDRRPCAITPYHHRLDWLLWFAAMGEPDDYPWVAHLVWKLLHGHEEVSSLLFDDPFAERPPRAIRIELYRYEFAPMGDDAWWLRTRLRAWLPPLTVNDTRLRQFLAAYGLIATE